MENIERGWQATTRKIRNRLQHVLDSPAEFPPDIYFQVDFPDGEQQKIGAHKLVLAAGSEVFYAMLLGSMAEKEPCIHIPDLHPFAFRQMLTFLYTDRIPLMSEDSGPRVLWLAFRTMECARKYDIPELYFACRSLVVQLIDEDHVVAQTRQICTTALIEAFNLGDAGLVDLAYYSILKFECCVFDKISLKAASCDLLCHILQQNETILCEGKLYKLCLSWAKVQCGAKATANELKTALGKARYLIRFGEMIPSAVANGPSKDRILSAEEVRLVYQKQFGSSMTEHYPFSEGKRIMYKPLMDGGDQPRPTERMVRFPIKVKNKASTLFRTTFSIVFRPEMSLDTCRKFSNLCDLKYPFELCVDGVNLFWTQGRINRGLSDEQKDLAKDIFTNPTPPGPTYVITRELAVAEGDSGYLELHVVVRPGFKPTKWIVVGCVRLEDEVELLKGIHNMENGEQDEDLRRIHVQVDWPK